MNYLQFIYLSAFPAVDIVIIHEIFTMWAEFFPRWTLYVVCNRLEISCDITLRIDNNAVFPTMRTCYCKFLDLFAAIWTGPHMYLIGAFHIGSEL